MAEKIVQRIDGALKSIREVQQRMEGITFEDFSKSTLLHDAVSFVIAQIGERMNKLEELLGNKYPNLPWKQARRMRNLIVHDYDNVSYEKVYNTATVDLEILKQDLLKIKDDITQASKHTLETNRLGLRPWDDFDGDELFELAKEPEIGRWCGWEPHKRIADSMFVLHNFLEVKENYAICLKSDKKLIGSIGLNFDNFTRLPLKDGECELGFWIGKPFWGNGYASEAADRLIKHAFDDLNLSLIWFRYVEGNEKSKRIQEKLGFEFDRKEENEYISKLFKEKWQNKKR